VHEGGRVEHLEGRRGEHDAGQGGRGILRSQRIERVHLAHRRLPAPVAEQRSEALAAGEEAPCGAGELAELRGDGTEFGRALVEEDIDALLHQID
jgi:hypothetical protein